MTLDETFSTLSSSDILEMINRRQEEHLQLEFKTTKGPGMTSPDDRRNFAKALSGFANSSGGILIWGIVAKKILMGLMSQLQQKR